jgi:hypothetical protein
MADRLKVLLAGSHTATVDLNLLKLARFMGIQAEAVSLADDAGPWGTIRTSGTDGPICFAASAKAFLELSRNPDLVLRTENRLLEQPLQGLIYGFEPSDGYGRVLSWLTDGRTEAVREIGADSAHYEIVPNCPSICGQMSGVSLGPILPENDFIFQRRPGGTPTGDLITIRGEPFFFSLNRGPARLFFIAGKDIADIDGEFDTAQPLERFFSRLVPFIMFLRHAFQGKCWHAPRSFASLVIDDPLLKNRYGGLDYARLLGEMDRSGFYSNIAFIPVNYRRSRMKTVDLFYQRPDRYALCVHGCEHTKSEFGETRLDILEDKVARATLWMNRHQSLTKLPFDKIMVFPQGIFSKEAMKVLQNHRFLAAVNTDPHPVPYEGQNSLRLSAFLEPAITAYENFPLFLRRYPGNLAGFAFDLFLGKPALIVIHQDSLCGGYEGLRELVNGLNALDPRLCWDRLASIAAGTYLIKEDSLSGFAVRAYSDLITLENTASRKTAYRISKAEPNEHIIDRIELTGAPLPFRFHSGQIFIKVTDFRQLVF